MMRKNPDTILAGDIGGTKTNLAIFSREAGTRKLLAEATFSSGDYQGFGDMAREFLSGTDFKVDQTCIGVAGPVLRVRAKVTNLSWVLEGKKQETDLGFSSVRLMNELHAVAKAEPLLEEEDLFVLNPGRQDPEGSRAVIAFCTGLGEAYLSWDGSTLRACPSEGGRPISPRRTGFRQICSDT